MQRVTNKELEDREQIINEQILRSQKKEVEAHKEIEALYKEQERLIKENAKTIEELKKE